jgi:NADH-quinone oxidoreductase subunit C
MLLVKIKEALNSLYEDIQEAAEAPEVAAAETAPVAEEVPAPEASAAEGGPGQEEEAKPAEAEPAADAAAARPGPQETDYKAKGYHLDVDLPPEKVVAAAEILNRENFFIEAITGVDWIDAQQLEVVYDFNHFDELCRVVVRSRLDRSNPAIPTISHIYQGANWHERETHDFFGITFTGHPNLEPLLLPEDADFHPLLKDFKA